MISDSSMKRRNLKTERWFRFAKKKSNTHLFSSENLYTVFNTNDCHYYLFVCENELLYLKNKYTVVLIMD